MDTIFFNGCIRTLDNSEKVAEAVGIENGRIVFVGTDKEAEAFSCKKRIDAIEGKCAQQSERQHGFHIPNIIRG